MSELRVMAGVSGINGIKTRQLRRRFGLVLASATLSFGVSMSSIALADSTPIAADSSVVAAAPEEAAAQSVSAEQCADSYVAAQTMRQEGDLLEARTELLTCASATCMAAVQKDCAQWLTEIESSLPTVVFEISGAEVHEVQLTVDGVDRSQEVRSGRAVFVNPGARVFRAKFPSGEEVEAQVTVLEGQKNKVVQIKIAEEGGQEPTTGGSKLELTPGEGSSAGPLPWVLAGVGVASLGVATGFWLSANSQVSDLDARGCAPRCPESDQDSIKRSRLIGDIGLGVGLVSLGVAAAIWINHASAEGVGESAQAQGVSGRKSAVSSLRFDVGALPGGSFAHFSGAF